MDDKLMFTLDEIAQKIGVHKNTVRRKMHGISDFFVKNQRKRLYNPTEVALIISLFDTSIQEL